VLKESERAKNKLRTSILELSEILCSLTPSDSSSATFSRHLTTRPEATTTSNPPNTRIEATDWHPEVFYVRSNWLSVAAEQRAWLGAPARPERCLPNKQFRAYPRASNEGMNADQRPPLVHSIDVL
jgi:hypothetical protein